MPSKNYEKINKKFVEFSNITSRIVGSPEWFVFSIVVILIWIPSRWLFTSNELWHLFINTFTTILTFLMMALLHSSQSRWEKKMERLEEHQQRVLKLLEKDTMYIKSGLERIRIEKLVNTNESKSDLDNIHNEYTSVNQSKAELGEYSMPQITREKKNTKNKTGITSLL